METVFVSMRRSYVYQGKHYGPGSAVSVPVGLQSAMNLQIVDAPADAPLPTTRELPAYLATLTLEKVRALQDRDDRKSARPMYDARIAELEKAEEEKSKQLTGNE